MKTPCEGCLLLAICRNKPLNKFINDCSNIKNYVGALSKDLNNSEFTRLYHRRIRIENIIKPTRWRVDIYGYLTSF